LGEGEGEEPEEEEEGEDFREAEGVEVVVLLMKGWCVGLEQIAIAAEVANSSIQFQPLFRTN